MSTTSGLIAVAVAVVFVVVFITVAIRGGEKIMAERAAQQQNTTPAQATILSYEQKGGGRDNQGRYSSIVFTLEVKPANGAAYQAVGYWKVYPMAAPNVQVGMTVPVKVNASDAQAVYPNLPSVEVDWAQAQIEKARK
jgi:hypothetical protein